MAREVLVVIGAGGMGSAICRRLARGSVTLLAGRDEAALAAAAEALRADGHEGVAEAVEAAWVGSVPALAKAAGGLGAVTRVARTAGLSPTQASAAAVLRVDLLGTAIVLDELGSVVAPGGAGVVVASMAGHLVGS